MRPKKLVLIVNADEIAASVMSLMLVVNGYRVLKTGTVAEAKELWGAHPIDLVILRFSSKGPDVLKLAKELRRPDCKILLIAEPGKIVADECIVGPQALPIEMLEFVKQLCARKRGPKFPVKLEVLAVVH